MPRFVFLLAERDRKKRKTLQTLTQPAVRTNAILILDTSILDTQNTILDTAAYYRSIRGGGGKLLR